MFRCWTFLCFWEIDRHQLTTLGVRCFLAQPPCVEKLIGIDWWHWVSNVSFLCSWEINRYRLMKLGVGWWHQVLDVSLNFLGFWEIDRRRLMTLGGMGCSLLVFFVFLKNWRILVDDTIIGFDGEDSKLWDFRSTRALYHVGVPIFF